MTAWITALCVTAVGCGLLVALKPRRAGGVGKGASFTASPLMLTVLLSTPSEPDRKGEGTVSAGLFFFRQSGEK